MAALILEVVHSDDTELREYGTCASTDSTTVIGHAPCEQVTYIAHAHPDVSYNVVGGCTIFRYKGKILTAVDVAFSPLQ